jgi:Sec-independent protein translocase protein TatA
VKYVLFAILIYVLYQFIFNLVIPVYQTTRKIKKGFSEMNNRMNEQHQQYSSQTTSKETKPKVKAGDYIDFEEMK